MAEKINKRILTEALRRMANEVAPGKYEGRNETFHERLARMLWLSACGYVHAAVVQGEEVEKLVLPNLGSQAIILDRLEGKVPSCNAEDEVGVPATTGAQVSTLGVARLNALSKVATSQPPDAPVN